MPKQVIVKSSIEAVEIIDTPVPTPTEKQVVIKVVVSGTNPKDWKAPTWYIDSNIRKNPDANLWIRVDFPHNSGDDIAGIVCSVGKDVYEFKPGDRVAAFHQIGTENGSFAEYAVAPDYTTFHLPKNISFEDAATIPLAALTAALALFLYLELPPPYVPKVEQKKVPILIYGVSTAVGAFAAQLARISGFGPIIGVAGRAGDFARSLADHVVDYRLGEDQVVANVDAIMAKEGFNSKVPYVFDAISGDGSFEATARLVDPNGGRIVATLPPKVFARDKENFEYPSGAKATVFSVPSIHSRLKDFGYIWSRYLSRLLEDGRFKAHPYEVIPGGLAGVLTGLKRLRNGDASAVKYVYKIEDTDSNLSGLLGDPARLRNPPVFTSFKDFPDGDTVESNMTNTWF
jgi:NADPH2:quinone reductase